MLQTLLFGGLFNRLPYASLSTSSIAKRGEKAAVRLLRRRGWYILGTNIRFGRDEVDIIALDADEHLHLIEVRASTKAISPRLTISNRKKSSMKRVLALFKSNEAYNEHHPTLSVVGVNLCEKGIYAKLHTDCDAFCIDAKKNMQLRAINTFLKR